MDTAVLPLDIEGATSLISASAGLGSVSMWETATEAVRNLHGGSLSELVRSCVETVRVSVGGWLSVLSGVLLYCRATGGAAACSCKGKFQRE